MYKYLEVVDDDSNEVVQRLDVSDKSERSVERIENGMNINLNHSKYTTQINTSEVKLSII